MVFITATYLFEMYLQFRQHRRYNITEMPVELKGIIPQETFDKARVYGRDKSWYIFASQTWTQIETMLILLLGGLPYAWNLAGDALESLGVSHSDHEIWQSMVFLFICTFYQVLVHLPWNMYYTFVVEAKHGFNKQTLGFYFKDQLKSFILTIVVSLLLAAPLIHIVQTTGDQFYFYAWLFVLAFSLISITIYPDYIAPRFDTFEPLPQNALRTRIEQLAASIHFPLGRLLVVKASKRSSHSNAYYYGFLKSKTIVLFDTLFEAPADSEDKDAHHVCNDDEVLGVLSHELGHWKLNHTLQMLCIAQANALLSFWMFGQLMHNEHVYVSFGFDTMPTLVGLVLVLQFILAPINMVASFLINRLTRKNEFQADAFAAGLGYADPLQSALIKLQIGNLGAMNPDPWYSEYHYSHPPLVERLHALRALAKKAE